MKRPAPAGQMKQPQQARGVQAFAKTPQWVPEDDLTCPLCIEPMDHTDMNFRPCPCGYRMCLFCYQKVVEMCSSVCPNCRREYGSAMEDGEVCNNNAGGAPFSAEQQQRIATAHNAAGRAGGPAGEVHAGGGGAALHAGPNHIAAAAATAQRAAAAAVAAPGNNRNGFAGPVQARPRGAEGVGGGAPARAVRAEDAPALPSGAVWAAQAKPAAALQHEREDSPPQNAVRAPAAAAPAHPPPVIADSTAWPDLAAAVAPPPLPPPPHPRPQKEREPSPSTSHGNLGALQHRQQAAQQQTPAQQEEAQQTVEGQAAVVRMDSSAMACDPVVSPEQLGLQPAAAALPPHTSNGGFQTVQVSTQVLGHVRNINVVLPPSVPHPEVYAEAPAVRARVEKGLQDGTMDKLDGATLLALLTKPHGDAPRMQAVPRPPPGFAPPCFSPAAAAHVGASALSPADSLVIPSPPTGRFPPIGKPIEPPSGGGDVNAGGNSSNNNNNTSASRTPYVPGTYSLWGGPTPAIDLGNPSTSHAATSLNNWLGGASYGTGLHHHDGLQAGALGGGFGSSFGGFGGSLLGNQPNNNAVSPLLNKPPPPGFGPAPQPFNAQHGVGEAGMLGLGQQNVATDGYYNPLGSSFNFAAARGPPPGMTAVYR